MPLKWLYWFAYRGMLSLYNWLKKWHYLGIKKKRCRLYKVCNGIIPNMNTMFSCRWIFKVVAKIKFLIDIAWGRSFMNLAPRKSSYRMFGASYKTKRTKIYDSNYVVRAPCNANGPVWGTILCNAAFERFAIYTAMMMFINSMTDRP